MPILDELEARWQPTSQEVLHTMKEWRRQHPKATFQTEHDHPIDLARSYATCPQCGAGLFPLDEELALLPGLLTPALQEALVRLGTRMPFRSVVQDLAFLKHVTTTEATVRRHTETAGATYAALQTAEVERLERTPPPAPPGAARQLLSADGATVPLRHGEWAEVKTVAIGEIQPPVLENAEAVVHTTNLSYFSRWRRPRPSIAWPRWKPIAAGSKAPRR